MTSPFATAAILLISLGTMSHTAKAEPSRPNVVVILTDDQGWGDLSVNGNTNLATPQLDSLARDGVQFENFYVCQVCAPTRAEFLTGRYFPKTGVSGVSRGEERMNPDETTIAEVFRKAGYATGCFGKWHNGTQPPLHPNYRGFDEFYGFTSGHWGHYFSPILDHNGQRVRGQGYVVDDFTSHAIAFIRAQQTKPFFCYLALNTPHSPMMVSDRFYQKFAHSSPKLRHRDPMREDVMMTKAALAMCENIDWNVGRLLTALDRLEQRENTIVVYFCDNGPNSYRWNGGMKGRKGSIDEGGIRSPLFIRWPKQIAKGLKIDKVAGAIDLLPTLAQLAGIPAATEKPMDGVSLAKLLSDPECAWPSRALFSTKNNQVSVRTEEYRLDPSGKLFHIVEDRGQLNDISSQFPMVAARLGNLAASHANAMQKHFAANKGRSFHVGYGPNTTLPARDGIEHGDIRRSAKAPNNSFFTHWTKPEDSITWDIDVASAGRYSAVIHYTCRADDVGAMMELGVDEGPATRATVTEAFDPPLYDKSLERVAKSHYFMKDFKPLSMGDLRLEAGKCRLRLRATKIAGQRAIDLHSIDLIRVLD